MSNTKPVTYNDNDRAIVNALKGTEGLTLTEINEATNGKFVSGNIVSAMKKGLIEVIGEKEVNRPSKRTVSTYTFVTSDALTNDDKPFNYTDNEKNVLAYASTLEGEFTLADLAKAMGVAKLSSGSINGLVKKGNIAKGAGREIEGFTKSVVKVYGFVKDVPETAEATDAE